MPMTSKRKSEPESSPCNVGFFGGIFADFGGLGFAENLFVEGVFSAGEIAARLGQGIVHIHRSEKWGRTSPGQPRLYRARKYLAKSQFKTLCFEKLFNRPCQVRHHTLGRGSGEGSGETPQVLMWIFKLDVKALP